MNLKNVLIPILNKLPYVRGLYKTKLKLEKEKNQYWDNAYYPPAHYHSPIVSVEDLKKRESEIWKKDDGGEIAGINLRASEQIELLRQFVPYYNELPFTAEKQDHLRYQFNNGFYSYTDGIVLYSIIRHFKPKRIIEIGSGFSSALMLDANELFFDNDISLTFIEPYPDRLHSLMTDKDRSEATIYESRVQSVSPDVFKKLQAGDILFVDSSHVVKTGSDVNYVLFDILPVLNSGVLIHFHDVFYPFEYPKDWVYLGRNWNEDYFLKAFLMYNEAYEIQLFSGYLHRFHKDTFKEMPLTYENKGANLWLKKK